jgi:hypothetical protein
MNQQQENSMSHAQNPDDLVEDVFSKAELAAWYSNGKDQVESNAARPGRNPLQEPISRIEVSEPDWFYEIPVSVRPCDSSARRLEELRRQIHIPHRVFASMVLQSPGITKIMVERQFEDFRRRRPGATNKELFTSILQFRYLTTDIADGMAPEDARAHLRQPWRQSIIQSVIAEISTIDDLVHYIADEYEEFWKHISDPAGVNSQIAEILGYQRQD